MSDLAKAGPPMMMASEDEQIAAVEGYVSTGLHEALVPVEGHSVVTPASLREVLDALLRHLVTDHPANYLPLREHQAEVARPDPLGEAIARQSPKIEGEPPLAPDTAQ